MIFDAPSPESEKHTEAETQQFWKLLEEILTEDSTDDVEGLEDDNTGIATKERNFSGESAVVNAKLVKYLKFATDSYRDFINSDRDLYRMALILVESPVFTESKDFCLSKLLSLLNIDLLSMSMKFLIAYILLVEAKKDLHSLEKMMEYQGFNVFYNTVYTQFAYLDKYGDQDRYLDPEEARRINGRAMEFTEEELLIIEGMKEISTVLLDLLFQIFKFCKCTVANVRVVDDFFVHFLMSSIRSDTTSDLFSNSEFKVLVALNEQYMMFQREPNMENKVYKYLLDTTLSKNFVELLFLQFNRLNNPSLQIMICKVVYLVVNTDESSVSMNFFYLNDLKVFVDVLIRQLRNFSEEEEVLRHTFLHVLRPLLKNTELAKIQYRKEDLRDLLDYLMNLDSICTSGEISEEHRVTVKLAFKCLNEVSWLQGSNPDSSAAEVERPLSAASSISMSAMTFVNPANVGRLYDEPNASAESLGRRRSRPVPPPPPSRKGSVHSRPFGLRSVQGMR